MTSVPLSPVPTPRPRPVPAGPAGSRPGGPAGTRPSGRAWVRPPGRAATPGTRQHLEQLTRAFAMLFLEVEAGRRPRRQLAPLLAPLLYTRLAGIWHRGGAPGSVESVRILGLEGPRCDAVVMVRRGPRRGAIAVQLVRGRSGWRIEDLARPEDRALPPAPYPVTDGDTEDDAAGEIPMVVVGADRTQMARSPRSG